MESFPTEVIPLYIGAGLAFPLTILWILAHVYGLFQVHAHFDEISQRLKIAWAIAAVGGFMGPCVILASVVGMIMAMIERRKPDATPATVTAARYVILASAIILVMTAVLVLAAAVSMMMGA